MAYPSSLSPHTFLFDSAPMQGLVVFRPKNPTQDHVSVLRRGGFFVLIKVLRPAHEPGRAAASQDLLVTLAAHHLAMLGPAKHVPLAFPAFLAFFHVASLMPQPRSALATPSFSPRRNHSSHNYTLHRGKMQLTASTPKAHSSKPYHVSHTTDHGAEAHDAISAESVFA